MTSPRCNPNALFGSGVKELHWSGEEVGGVDEINRHVTAFPSCDSTSPSVKQHLIHNYSSPSHQEEGPRCSQA